MSIVYSMRCEMHPSESTVRVSTPRNRRGYYTLESGLLIYLSINSPSIGIKTKIVIDFFINIEF